ncbi:MAG TPA: DUF481 domain-containing protein [Puia sp.]|nr:DUF481 domain-containing protein [Puia sp.]
MNLSGRRSMLRIIFIFSLTFCCFVNHSFCQTRDSIILYNGESLIGEVQSSSLGSITIDDIDLKMLSIKLYKIKTLIIHDRFKIETIDKKIYFGTLRTSDRDGWVDIHLDDGQILPIHIVKIYLLTSLDTDILRRLNGNVSAGLSFTKSSQIGQVNFSATVQLSTKLFNYQLSVSAIGSIDSGKYSRDNENIFLVNSYDLTPTWFTSGAAQYQRNLELSISRRYLFMLGIGNKLIIKKNMRLLATTGMTFSQEKSIEGVSSGLLFDLPIMFQFNYYQFRHPDIQISSTQIVYFGIGQNGRVRYDGSTTFSWQLIRYFYLNLSPYTNFDSQPPAGSGSNFDYGIVFGLSYKF